LTTGPRNSRGFTLLELVLVMVIICTVLGAASVSLRGFFVSRKTHDTAARIVSLARLARSMAVSEGRPYRLVFDAARGAFYVTAQRRGGFAPPRNGLGRALRLPDEVDLQLEVPGAAGERDYVEFTPDGRAEPAVVRLTDIKGGVLEVRCAAPTEPFVVASPEEGS
jgi:type II secretion system protein H